MTNQERNREALIDHIADQDSIIRRRNEQIANQARNAGEAQRAIDEQAARNYSLAADLAAAVVRAEKAEKERDEYRAMHSKQIKTIARLQKAERSRALTADDITDEEQYEEALRQAGRGKADHMDRLTVWLTGSEWARKRLAPPRPEGAEKVEAVLNQYWSGDINGDDLADRIVEEMNR